MSVDIVQKHSQSFTKYGDYECCDSCQHNNQVAMVERLVMNGGPFGPAYPPSDGMQLQRLDKVLAAIARCFVQHTAHTPLTGREVMEAFRGQNDNIESQLGMLGFETVVKDPERYQRVYDFWRDQLFNGDEAVDAPFLPPSATLAKYAHIRPFGKVEFISNKKWPRNISPRDPKFNFIWAAFTKPMESYFYHHLSAVASMKKFCDHAPEPGIPNPWIGKCGNAHQRANLLKYKIALFKARYGVDPIILSLDCTGWDAHVTAGVCKCECQFFAKCFPQYYRYVESICNLFIKNKFFSDGIRGYINGGRMSGDMHTGLGNCILMIALIVTSLCNMHIRIYDILDDGDDVLLFLLPEHHQQVIRDLPGQFLLFGQELKLEKVAHSLEEVVWCQSKVIRVVDKDGVEQHVFVRDISKIMQTVATHIHSRTLADGMEYFSSVYYAYGKLYPFLPIFANCAEMRVETKRRQRIHVGLGYELVHNSRRIELFEGENTISDYCRAFGIDYALMMKPGVTREQLFRALTGIVT